MDNGQKRAKVGGEVGPNGDWYKGGAFIATTDRPKSYTAYIPPSDEELARRAEVAERMRIAQEKAVAKVEKVRDVIDGLKNAGGEFYLSLAQQLEISGDLSYKQARFVCKLLIGREIKKNYDAYDALLDRLVRE